MSVNNRSVSSSALTRWYSRVIFQEPGQEVIDGFRECFVEALQKYYEVTNLLAAWRSSLAF